MSESRNQIESVINIPQMVDGSQVLFNLKLQRQYWQEAKVEL
jgi:hypothetical protein